MSDNQDKKLFDDFPPVSVSDWEELIRRDLKGADYEKKLICKTIEGIPVKPCYTPDDISGLDHLRSLPGEYPFARGKKTDSNDWLVREDIPAADVARANDKALDSLMKGAGSVGFVLDGSKTYTQKDIARLLHNICLASAEINFVCDNPPENLPEILDQENVARGGAVSDLHGSVEYDPLGTLFTTGNYPFGEEKAFGAAAAMAGYSPRIPRFTMINVNGTVFHNAGGSAVQELAFAMASAAEYLGRLTSGGLSAEDAARSIRFTFSAGSNYFMEIAKFRAARYLWSRLLEAWDTPPQTAGRMVVNAVTSMWNKTLYDPYVNILRSTTEVMSAVLGGADSVIVLPFDKPFRNEGASFSQRIARNIHLIMKEEAYFDKVIDPAAGSYYIESLTSSLIGESWKFFLRITDEGGIPEAFKKGVVQELIGETAAKRDSRIATRKDVLVGTNYYPNPGERASENAEGESFWPATDAPGETVAAPLKLYRGAQAFEELRLKTERHGGEPPGVFLLTCGDPVMRKARAGFSSGFFGCAGFNIIDNPGFDTAAAGAEAALESGASIVVVCSSDEEYPEIVPEIAVILKGKTILVVAGNPKESADRLREAGVKYFIHMRSNVLEMLLQFQEELGIK